MLKAMYFLPADRHLLPGSQINACESCLVHDCDSLFFLQRIREPCCRMYIKAIVKHTDGKGLAALLIYSCCAGMGALPYTRSPESSAMVAFISRSTAVASSTPESCLARLAGRNSSGRLSCPFSSVSLAVSKEEARTVSSLEKRVVLDKPRGCDRVRTRLCNWWPRT